jgi:hypothetical protein
VGLERRMTVVVGRRALQIIEKLSVQAPSGEVKLKLMKEIAAEHNIEWDSSDFEAELLKAPEDLLVRHITIFLPSLSMASLSRYALCIHLTNVFLTVLVLLLTS